MGYSEIDSYYYNRSKNSNKLQMLLHVLYDEIMWIIYHEFQLGFYSINTDAHK